jgi:hypothetical protein
MRIDPLQTIHNRLHPQKIQEDKGKKPPEKSPNISRDSDEIALSKDMKDLRRLRSLATSESVENTGITEERRALIQQRISSGYYSQSDVEQETGEKMTQFLFR